MCTVRKIPNLLIRIKKHSLLNSSRSPAVTELFANVNVNDKRVSRQKRAVNAFEPPVEKHRVVFTGRAFWTIQRSGLVFFFSFPLSSLFFIPLLPIPSVSPRGEEHRGAERRERFISTTPVAIVPFVSQPASHASRRRAFSLTSSVFHPHSSSSPVRWLTRTPYGRFDRWTNRPVVISTYPQVHA